MTGELLTAQDDEEPRPEQTETNPWEFDNLALRAITADPEVTRAALEAATKPPEPQKEITNNGNN